MSLLNFPVYDCENESDVEQKLIHPLLTHPSFLDIPSRAVLTKRSLSSFSFTQKSSLPKNYVPDFVVFFSGFPICVVEAKGPDVPVDKAITEARLYAQVLNASFPAGTNPVLMAVGCNGRELVVSPWDSNDSQKFNITELLVGSGQLSKLGSVLT